MLVSCVASMGYSQFLKKGSIIGGGSFEFQTTKNKDVDSKGHSLFISPRAGYLVIDNLVAGAGLGLGNSGSKSGSSEATANSIYFTPFARYYLDKGLFFHGEYSFGVNKIKTDFNGSETTFKVKSSNYRLGLGYAVRITDTVLFEPMIGYYRSSNDAFKTSGLFINGGFTIILKTVQ